MEALTLQRMTAPKMQTGWRNKYWLRYDTLETISGKRLKAGDHWAPQVWASRDLAETYAEKTLAVWAAQGRANDIEHLGASMTENLSNDARTALRLLREHG